MYKLSRDQLCLLPRTAQANKIGTLRFSVQQTMVGHEFKTVATIHVQLLLSVSLRTRRGQHESDSGESVEGKTHESAVPVTARVDSRLDMKELASVTRGTHW